MPFLPIHDRNPRLYIRAHYVTIALVIANVAIFVAMLGLNEEALYESVMGYALVPGRLLGDAVLPAEFPGVPAMFTLITYQFLHGGWEHIVFNMLFLWVFGDNIEDALGHAKFIGFFLVCGVIGGLVHAAVDTQSLTPTVGASGAISGVLGAYLVLYPRARLTVLAFGFIPLRLPALLVIGTFFMQDLLRGLFGEAALGGVAVWAHIGGFIAGAALVVALRRGEVGLWHPPPSPWK